MKGEYIKIISLLIALFYVNILEISNIKNQNKKRKTDGAENIDYFRLLNGDYTVGRNDEDDKKSIENCKNSDENYFSILVKGDKFKFDKYVDERDSVSNNNL